jgi:hypothetical protein
MNPATYRSALAFAVIVVLAPRAEPASPAPPFEVAYRAWDLVTELARQHRDPSISGECGKTFRPFVIPGLRMQNKQDQDLAAVACVEAARSACMNSKVNKPTDVARKCDEFR